MDAEIGKDFQRGKDADMMKDLEQGIGKVQNSRTKARKDPPTKLSTDQSFLYP